MKKKLYQHVEAATLCRLKRLIEVQSVLTVGDAFRPILGGMNFPLCTSEAAALELALKQAGRLSNALASHGWKIVHLSYQEKRSRDMAIETARK